MTVQANLSVEGDKVTITMSRKEAHDLMYDLRYVEDMPYGYYLGTRALYYNLRSELEKQPVPDLSPLHKDVVRSYLKHDRYIDAIKHVRQQYGYSLRDAKTLVDREREAMNHYFEK